MGERRRVAGGVLLIALGGCGTTGSNLAPHPDRVGQALTQVLSAEAEPIGIDTRAHRLRRQARLQYREATWAMAEQDYARANRLIDRAQVDAELAVALARQQAWTLQVDERSAALRELELPLPGQTTGGSPAPAGGAGPAPAGGAGQ